MYQEENIMSMTAKLTRTVPTLTASEFLKHLKDGTLPERYTVNDDVNLMRMNITKDMDFGHGIFNGDFHFGWTIIEGYVLCGQATFKGDFCYDQATFKGDFIFERATFKGGVYAGSNPALAWQLSQHQQGTIYSTHDARLMCGHPRPMVGWEWYGKRHDYVFTGN
jgi:hypothetical protein